MFARQPTRKGTSRPSALSRFASGSFKSQPSEASESSTAVSSSPASSVASLALSEEPAPINGRVTPSKAATLPPKKQLTRQDSLRSLRPSALKRFSTSAVSLVKGQDKDKAQANGAETPASGPLVSSSPTSSVSSLPLGPPEPALSKADEELRTKLDAAEGALANESQKATRLEEQVKVLETTNAGHEAKEAAQQQMLDTLQAQLSVMQAELAQLRDELVARDNRLEALRMEAAAQKAVQEEVRRSLEGRLEDAHAKLEAAQAELGTRDEALRAATSSAEEMVYERDALLKKVGGLEADVKTAKDDAKKEKDEAARLKEELKKAQSGGVVSPALRSPYPESIEYPPYDQLPIHSTMLANRTGSLSSRKQTFRPSPLTRFSTSVVSLLKSQPAEASATSVTPTPTLPVASLTSSPTSSVLSLPLSSDFGDDAATKAMEELRKKLDASEAALAAKSRTAAGLEERVQSLVAENEEEARRRGQQDETRRQAEERLAEVERRLAEALAEITTKDLELETARSEVIDETRVAQQETNDELASAEKHILSKTEEIKSLSEELSKRSTAMAEVEAELAQERTMCASLHSEVQATKDELENIKGAKAQSEDENAELRATIAQLRGEAVSRSMELETADLKVRTTVDLLPIELSDSGQLEETGRVLLETSRRLKTERERCEEVEAELVQAKQRNAQLDDTCTKLTSELKAGGLELEELHQRTVVQDQEVALLHSQAEAYTANAETLAGQLAETARARDDALSELSAMHFQFSEVSTARQRAAETAMHELTEVRWQAMKTESALVQRSRDLEEALRCAQDDAAQEIKKLRGEMRRLREEMRKADVAAGGSCAIQ
ncbi:hypothetical protein FOMPIDRAFT_1042857 [Fomitopsis schrenkii]|uniref:Uncharacterized protein n=1 Tax=Fomitopsis schrenkii TaxID=2126942 RepID=S8E289_FOMSC|nr:hypothetical protein FOMPIDRAFT_1042857 [Fomitopsis schrenkii]